MKTIIVHQKKLVKRSSQWSLLFVVIFILIKICLAGDIQTNSAVAVLRFSDSWRLAIYGGGSARLNYGALPGDCIVAPPGTFNVGKVRADIQAAIDAAGPTPDFNENPAEYNRVWESAALSAGLYNGSAENPEGKVAIFTPEVMAYCDHMLRIPLSARMQEITNLVPPISGKLMKSLADWTNSPGYMAKAGKQTGSSPVSTPGVGKPREVTELHPVSLETSSQVAIPETVAKLAKERSMGIRGWIVAVLLAIAAFLTYRFIRLRLGS